MSLSVPKCSSTPAARIGRRDPDSLSGRDEPHVEENSRLIAQALDLQPKVLHKGFLQSIHGQLLSAPEAIAASKRAAEDYQHRKSDKAKADDEILRENVDSAPKKAAYAERKKEKAAA